MGENGQEKYIQEQLNKKVVPDDIDVLPLLSEMLNN